MASAQAGDSFDNNLRSVVDQGFRAVKICIDNFDRRDISKSDKEWDRCEAKLLGFARKIVGKNVQLVLDACGSDLEWTGGFDWSFKTTTVPEELDSLWIEEPLAPEALEDFIRLTQLQMLLSPVACQ